MRNSTITQWVRAGRKNRTASATIFVAALLILTGCSTTPTPPETTSTGTNTPTSPGTAASAPATATPSSVAVYQPATANGPAQNVPVPVLPEKAKEFSKEGLLAFAEHWYATLGYVFETGDPGPMMAITEADCTTCANINGPVGKWYAKGGWIVGGLMTVHSSTSSFEQDADGSYQAVIVVQQSPASYFEPAHGLYRAYPPSIARADIVVASFRENKWTARTAEHLTKD